jgi:hypothetical protein
MACAVPTISTQTRICHGVRRIDDIQYDLPRRPNLTTPALTPSRSNRSAVQCASEAGLGCGAGVRVVAAVHLQVAACQWDSESAWARSRRVITVTRKGRRAADIELECDDRRRAARPGHWNLSPAFGERVDPAGAAVTRISWAAESFSAEVGDDSDHAASASDPVAKCTPCIALLSTDTVTRWCSRCIHCNSSGEPIKADSRTPATVPSQRVVAERCGIPKG